MDVACNIVLSEYTANFEWPSVEKAQQGLVGPANQINLDPWI